MSTSVITRRISAQEVGDLTLKLTKIEGETGNELNIALCYHQLLKDLGLQAELDYVEEKRPNVIGRIPGVGNGKSLMLHGHLDTIPIGNCVPPMIENGSVYGRGSLDDRGSLAAIAICAKSIIESGRKLLGDLYIVATVDEESPPGRGKGIASIVNRIRTGKMSVDAAINTDGPYYGVKIAQGGCALFTIKVSREGGTSYAATSTLSSNPILWSGEIIRRLEEMDKEMISRKRHPLISLRPTIQIGEIKGGDFVFTVPDVVELSGAIRWDPGEDYEEVTARLKTSMSSLEKFIQEKYDRSARIVLSTRIDQEACEVSGNSEIVQCLKRAIFCVTGKQLDIIGTRYVSELSVVINVGKIPAVEFGAVPADNVTMHTDHECVNIEDLADLTKIYSEAVMEFCGII